MFCFIIPRHTHLQNVDIHVCFRERNIRFAAFQTRTWPLAPALNPSPDHRIGEGVINSGSDHEKGNATSCLGLDCFTSQPGSPTPTPEEQCTKEPPSHQGSLAFSGHRRTHAHS